MINFIICDDNERDLKMVNDYVDKYMMKNKLEYQTHLFSDYDDDFLKIIDEPISDKIYILDIEAPSRSGVDVARIIRNKDVNSIIIFLTGHEELGGVVIKDEFLFLSFINKFDDCEGRINKVLNRAIKVLEARPRIKIKDGGISYIVSLDDILYITKDSVERKCVVKTNNMDLRLSRSLNSMKELLDANFVQTHRACIVNMTRVVSINKFKKIITFDNGETIDLLSDKYIPELI